MFFQRHFLIGIFMVMASIIVSQQTPAPGVICAVTLELIRTVGIAVIVASLFSYAAGTAEFMEWIKVLLQDIIIDRAFLGNIALDKKREALHALVRPSDSEKTRYSDIEEYYKLYIDRTLDIAKRNVRGNYLVIADAYRDAASGRIAIDATYSYRLYPSSTGFGKIEFGFYKDDKESKCVHIQLCTPSGECSRTTAPKMVDSDIGGVPMNKCIHELNQYNRDDVPYLDVEVRAIEYGFDHWIMHEFQALQPTDGFVYQLRLRDDLEFKKSAVFVLNAAYKEETEREDCYIIKCTQWITEGSGLAVIIGPRTCATSES